MDSIPGLLETVISGFVTGCAATGDGKDHPVTLASKECLARLITATEAAKKGDAAGAERVVTMLLGAAARTTGQAGTKVQEDLTKLLDQLVQSEVIDGKVFPKCLVNAIE